MADQDSNVLIVLARVGLGILSLSPFAVALDIWLHFLPDYPAMQYMRAANPIVQASWVGLGPIGIAAIVLLQSRPIFGVVLTFLFGAGYVPLARLLWGHFTWGCWLAVATVVLAVVGAALWVRANKSFKPAPLRDAA